MCNHYQVTEYCTVCFSSSELPVVLKGCNSALCGDIDKSTTYEDTICQACSNKQEVAHILAVADMCLIKRLINKESALVERLKMPTRPEQSWLEAMRGLELDNERNEYEEIFSLQRDIDLLLDECGRREERDACLENVAVGREGLIGKVLA